MNIDRDKINLKMKASDANSKNEKEKCLKNSHSTAHAETSEISTLKDI